MAPRTVNLDVIAFRIVMKRALSDSLIRRLPTEGLRPRKSGSRKRPLFTAVELDTLCGAAFETKPGKNVGFVQLPENAQQFVDYIRLMSYCGARRNEALGLKWEDVDFENGQLSIRRQITKRGIEELKNREQRVVDFNPKLKAHLLDMQTRRAPDSQWLFASPQRGDKNIPAKDWNERAKLKIAPETVLQDSDSKRFPRWTDEKVAQVIADKKKRGFNEEQFVSAAKAFIH